MSNQTFNISSICDICQISYGFTSADRRAIIVMVVLAGIALISCYLGVLWYSIYVRFIPDDKSTIVTECVHTNEAFDDEIEDENIEKNVQTTDNTAAILPVVFTLENEKERL